MQDITAPYEYVVAEKVTGKLRLRRAGLILLYILFPLTALVITAMSSIGPLLAAMCTFLALGTWMLVFFTWRYVSVEYEYSVVSGRVTFCKIYGGRSRKKMLEMTLKEAEIIAPLSDEYSGKIEDFALFRNSEGKKCVFYFEATARMLKICRMYNPSGTVMSKVRY